MKRILLSKNIKNEGSCDGEGKMRKNHEKFLEEIKIQIRKQAGTVDEEECLADENYELDEESLQEIQKEIEKLVNELFENDSSE